MTEEKAEKASATAGADAVETEERSEKSAVAPEPLSSRDTERVRAMPPPTPAMATRRERRSLLAPLALLLAILALLAAAFVWWEAERAAEGHEAAIAALHERLAEVPTALQNQAGILEQLARADDRLEESVAGREGETAALDRRLRDAERALRERSGLSSAARESLLRTEIEQYLRMANRAAQLARDPATALAALRVADDRLRGLDDPALVAVREQVTAEMDALEALPELDVEGVALRLGQLAARVDDLPLGSRSEEAVAATGNEPAQEPGFWSRTWAAMRGAMSSLVSVRRSDEEVTPLLAPAQHFFLRQNLRLELETARLAALRGDAANYATSLGNARVWLAEYFDTSGAPVASMADALDDLARVEVEPALPDLSGSLSALRDARREDSIADH